MQLACSSTRVSTATVILASSSRPKKVQLSVGGGQGRCAHARAAS
jgi:hypothetical protein